MSATSFVRRMGWWLALGLLMAHWLTGCSKSPTVILYCAQDQFFAEPILRDFSRETGIAVRAVYDSEAAKTVGLANRLLTEQARPASDVFWGNEEFQTRRLAAAGVFRVTNGWAAFGGRSRRLVSGPEHQAWISGGLIGLTNAVLRGRVSLAAPWFGSTATHFASLRAEWGAERWRTWCQALAANRPFLEDGNSGVVRRVARGEAWIGLTDSDDIQAGQREGLGLVAGPALRYLPNTVAVVRGAPHPVAAERLFRYLQTAAVHARLVAVGALEADGAVSGLGNLATPSAPPWERMIGEFEVFVRELRAIWGLATGTRVPMTPSLIDPALVARDVLGNEGGMRIRWAAGSI